MNIFSDFHHGGLYTSFIHLFEERLGYKLFRPIGKEWFDKGYWKIAEPYNNNLGTIEQYLGIRSVPDDGTTPLNEVMNQREGVYYVKDEAHMKTQRAIEFGKFCNMEIDIIIASIPAHIEPYKKLIEKYHPKAKLIFHIGNIGWGSSIDKYSVDNILASIKEVPTSKNVCFYRQEFDLGIFDYEYRDPNYVISSFVHSANNKGLFHADMMQHLPEFKFNDYGYSLKGVGSISEAMKRSTFGYHNKPGGDGFGHIIHNWMAVGKPIIVNLNDYKDKLAGELLIDGVTCIDMSARTPQQVAGNVREIIQGGYRDMCDNINKAFKEKIDFESDAYKVSTFINSL